MTRYSLCLFLCMIAYSSQIAAQIQSSGYNNTNNEYVPPGSASPQGEPFPSFQPGSFNTPAPSFGVNTSTTGFQNTTNQISTAATTPGYSFPQTSGVTSQGTTQGTLLQQVYPEPAKPNPTATPGQAANPATPNVFTLPTAPLESVAPPESLLPGIATIKKGRWMVSDFFYNLPYEIGVKIEVVKPDDRYVPLSSSQIEKRVKGILEDVGIVTEALKTSCQPPLPIFHVLIMVYPCDKRCVGFITVQLYEVARPSRIKEDLNGIWQVVTWERQALIASPCDDFAHEIGETVDHITTTFADRFKYYHPEDEIPCFNVSKEARSYDYAPARRCCCE